MADADKIAGTLLGKRIDGFSEYNPSILVAIPREDNRKQYNINSQNLPFEGWDIWHCYEFSALTKNGLPVTRVLKLRYLADSDFIIESKSLKLYLNSFNMTKLGEDFTDCLEKCKDLIQKDLSEKLKTEVIVNFLPDDTKREEIFLDYTDLMSLTGEKNIVITDYKENPKLLKIEQINENKSEYYLSFGSLRSNCRVTHQPDFGDLFIYYKSSKAINYDSLVKYLVSFRSEYHFHEECCEMIYKRLYDILDDEDELLVAALYTRRGGIDITPVRYSKKLKNNDVEKLIDLTKLARFGNKQ